MLIRRALASTGAVLALALAGCGSSGGGGADGGGAMTFSCSPSAPSIENTTSCLEYAGGWTQSQVMMLCGNVMATTNAMTCSRTNVIGGCRTTETLGLAPMGASTTIWYTPAMGQMVTAAQVMTHCATMGGYTFVAP